MLSVTCTVLYEDRKARGYSKYTRLTPLLIFTEKRSVKFHCKQTTEQVKKRYLTLIYAMKAYRVLSCVAPLILNLGTRWR